MPIEQKNILAAIKKGEDETIEFKRTFDRQAIETLASFANAKGGRVFVGITDKGKIEGIEVGKETVQNWINQVKQNTAHANIPDVELSKINGKTIATLSVPEYPIKPVSCRGRYYKRVLNSNHQMTVNEVVNENLKTFNTSWDYYLDDVHSAKDISLEKVQNLIDRINKLKESPVLDDPLTMLKKLELVRDGRVNRAAFFLFMSGESSLSTIELGRFQTSTIIKDGARLKTDLFSEVVGVLAFIKKHINKEYIITGSPQRKERWDYPLDALREIIVNAVVHRDYSSTSDSIIKVFDHKIEFFNPGKLPEGITIKKLMKGDYVSVIRNKKIADIFKEAGLIEKYGSGIKRILIALKKTRPSRTQI